MTGLRNTLAQMFPSKPGFTEKDVPDLRGKVYMVTGANIGVGRELSQILYSKNAKVYVTARSKEKAAKAIETIKERVPESAGELIYLHLDLADLTTIKTSAQDFLSKESKLHVLFNNAGVMSIGSSAKTAQGYEMHLGVNNVGTFMFTKLLTPILVATAKAEPPNTVRVIWVSSSGAELGTPPGGIELDNLDDHKSQPNMIKYSISKAGNYLHGVEFAKRYKADGVISIPLNPGNLNSSLYRGHPAIVRFIFRTFILHPSIYGAYTELFAGLSPLITIEETGCWVGPWGRIFPIRKDLVEASKAKEEGGSGIAEQFWKWNEEQIKPYL